MTRAKGHDVIVYTDGACWPNPGPSGSWAYAGLDVARREQMVEARFHAEATTNNQMELAAIHYALVWALSVPVKGRHSIHVISDSAVALSWSKKPPGRLDEQYLATRWNICALVDRADVTWSWVRGHSGVHGNELADSSAAWALRERSSHRCLGKPAAWWGLR